MNCNSNPSYTLHPSPSPSEPPLNDRSSPSPPLKESFRTYLPPIRIPNSHNNNHNNNDFQRQPYPKSSPYNHPAHASSDPNPMSRIRLPPLSPTSYFPNGYASPATSSYSSDPGSRDEIDMMEPGSLGGSNFHGHSSSSSPLQPGVDGMIMRGESGMHIDRYEISRTLESPREKEIRKRWSMKDFTLIQTVGLILLL